MENNCLYCPKCHVNVSLVNNQLLCNKCDSKWDIINNIPIFKSIDFYWGEIPEELMVKLNILAEKIGWDNALKDMLLPEYKDIYYYITSPNRANLHKIVPINSESRVLDLGSGWGSISFQLARKCKEIVSVEGVYERVKFCNIRKKQEKVDNMTLILSDFSTPPLPNEYFDVIVMNGIVEWAGLADYSVSPRDLQVNLLKNALRMLKPGGTLYIGIENRYGFDFFLGRKDHSGLSYTSLMPRFMADLYVKWNKNRYRVNKEDKPGGYHTYTYSHFGYKKLLKDAGFDNTLFYWVEPDYNEPLNYIRLDERKNLLNFLKRDEIKNYRLFKLLAKSCVGYHVAKFVTPEFGITATKNNLKKI